MRLDAIDLLQYPGPIPLCGGVSAPLLDAIVYIPAEWMAKDRARRDPRSGRWYTPSDTKRGQSLIGWEARRRLMLIQAARGEWPDRHGLFGLRVVYEATSDWDNVGKLVSDALQRVVYWNDRQVVEGFSRRVEVWKQPERLRFVLYRLEA